MAETIAAQMTCPTCDASIPVSPSFVTWCPACEWNVDPTPEPNLKWRERRAAQASDKASRTLYERIAADGVTGPPPRNPAITFVALLVHLLTLAILAAGISMLIYGFGIVLPIRVALGALAVGTAVFIQPFWYRRKWKSRPLNKADAPRLFELTDQIAGALGCKGIDGILIGPNFNASIESTRRHGWVVTMGLALWSTLAPQERVAILTHELAHQLNNDQRTGLIVHGAAVTMGRWAYLLTPSTSLIRYHTRQGLESVAELVAIVCMLPFAMAAAALSWLLRVLAGRQGLSAEYYADVLAAKVAGSDAAGTALEKLLLADGCQRHLIHTAKFNKSADPWQEVAAYAASVPPHEFERQRRLGRIRLPAIDSSHPPTQLRADLVRALPPREALVVLDAEQEAAIDRELSAATNAATARLRKQFPR